MLWSTITAKQGPRFSGKGRELQHEVLNKLHEEVVASGKRGAVKSLLEQYKSVHTWLTRSMYNGFVTWHKKDPPTPTSDSNDSDSSDETRVVLYKKAGRPKGSTNEAKLDDKRKKALAIDNVAIRYNALKQSKSDNNRIKKGTLRDIIAEEKAKLDLPDSFTISTATIIPRRFEALDEGSKQVDVGWLPHHDQV